MFTCVSAYLDIDHSFKASNFTFRKAALKFFLHLGRNPSRECSGGVHVPVAPPTDGHLKPVTFATGGIWCPSQFLWFSQHLYTAIIYICQIFVIWRSIYSETPPVSTSKPGRDVSVYFLKCLAVVC